MKRPQLKVALIHDDLVQWGGAERVLETLTEIFPNAPIFTSVFDYKNYDLVKRFSKKNIRTSFLQNIPAWRLMYKTLLPLYPLAFEQFDFSQFNLVISNTTRFAKNVSVGPGSIHISYCHTPPRFLWHFSGERNHKIFEVLLSYLRIRDQASAKKVDYFLAGSKNAQKRIKAIYKMDSEVLYPPVDLNRFHKIKSFDGGYYLIISRLNKYKRIDLAIEACNELDLELKIIGNGPQMNKLACLAGPQVQLLGRLSDKEVVRVLAGAKALVIPGIEDFGLTPIEAQALGKPVIAYKEGGSLETVIDGQTGIFFKTQTKEALKQALIRFNNMRFNPDKSIKNARSFDRKLFINKFKDAIDNLVELKQSNSVY